MEKMLDPAIDKKGREWCYAAKSTTVIGKPFMRNPVQITYDGAIYTRRAELAFFHGTSLKPLMARNKTFLEGWIPIVGYSWSGDDGVEYAIEIFADELPGLGLDNLAQFAKISMFNPGPSEKRGAVAAATRLIYPHFRKGDPYVSIDEETRFAMENGRFLRDNALVFHYSGSPAEYAVPGVPYEKPFTAKEHLVSYRSETGLVVYEKTLAPGETFSAEFKMPRIPVEAPQTMTTLAEADYEEHRAATIAFWRSLLERSEFIFPEPRVNASAKAAMVHLLLATRTRQGRRMQGSGLPYDGLFLNDYIDMLKVYERFSLDEFTEPNVDWLLDKQHDSGMFIDYHNRGNDDIVTSHGQGLFALVYKYIMTRDADYAEKIYPAVRKGVEFIINDHLNNNEHGLLRPSIPYDAPMVTGYHSCHNLHALAAMRISIRMADMLGENDDASRWREMELSYREAIFNALEDARRRYGYVTSGLFDWKPGFIQNNPELGENKEPNQDWENNLLIYPTELYPPDSETVKVTVDTIRRRKYREGCMTYRNNRHIHQYITINQAHQYLLMGERRLALLDFYHVLLHNGSTHEGFENLVEPWTNRTPYEECPPPHAWAAAKTALFARNMLILEYGGDLGIRPGERELLLFSVVSPDWVKPGATVEVRNAPTEMGSVSASMTFQKDGASISIFSDFHSAPKWIRVAIPYFVQMNGFESDARKSFEQDGWIFLSPDVTSLDIKWGIDEDALCGESRNMLGMYRSEYADVPDGNYEKATSMEPFLMDDEVEPSKEPLSFELVRDAFSKEFSRRFNEYVVAGGEPYEVKPPEMLRTPEQRMEFFGTQPPQKNMAWEDNVEL